MVSVFGPAPPNPLLHAQPKSARTLQTQQQQQQRRQQKQPPALAMFFNAVYYPNWHVYKQLPPSALNFDVISHAFYAFAHVKHDGTVHLSDEWADAQIDVDGTTGCLRSFAQLKEKYTILRVVLSVGGGGKGSEPFAHVAHHEETRHTFARTAKDLVTEYGLDGIDIDWEHPNSTQQGHDYVSLLQTLRTYMPAPIYTLTTALPAGQWALQHIPLARAAQHLDLINVMTYDFSGPWVPTAEHHAQLYAPRKPHSAHCGVSCQSAVSYFTSQGVSPKKLLLGVPAYGRSFLGAKGPGHSYRGHAGDEGTFLYKDLPRPGTKERVDDKTGAAYCVGGDGGFVSYDNAATVRQKAGFVKAEGLAGMFYWTGTGDDMDDKERSLVFNGYVGMHN